MTTVASRRPSVVASHTYQQMATEDELQASITELVDRLGGKWAHIRDSRGQPVEGFPDLVIALPPVVLFVELKSQHREVTDTQEEWLALLRSCVVPSVAIVRPEPTSPRESTLEELLRCLNHVRLLSAEEAMDRYLRAAAEPL